MELLYNANGVKAETNGSEEFFITANDVTIRITPKYGTGIVVTNHNGLLLPTSENGLSAFIAVKKCVL